MMMIASYTNYDDRHYDDDRIVHKWWWSSLWWWLHRTQVMMIVIIMMIASYTNDDDCHHYDYRIVHIVYALAMYDAIFFGNEWTNGQVDSRSLMYALLNSDWRLTQALEWKILISEVAKCLVKVPRSQLTGTQGGWERRTPMGIWWETEHIMLTRSSSGVGIAMWRGSTQMVGEPVWSHILSLGSTGRLQMEKGRATGRGAE